jgi:hypothetical protein
LLFRAAFYFITLKMVKVSGTIFSAISYLEESLIIRH